MVHPGDTAAVAAAHAREHTHLTMTNLENAAW